MDGRTCIQTGIRPAEWMDAGWRSDRERIDKQKNLRMDQQTDGQADGHTYRWTIGPIHLSRTLDTHDSVLIALPCIITFIITSFSCLRFESDHLFRTLTSMF